MFEDIGGWWLSCDHMFRRFGTPFAVDWIAKNVNGYLYTAAIPAEAELRIDATGVQLALRRPACPRTPSYAATIGAYLDAVLPVYGARLRGLVARPPACPRWSATSPTSRRCSTRADELNLAELACLLEDAIDIHDRHWKIHWMLNFAQLSATLNLRAVMEKTHGKVDEAAARPAPELGQGPQLGLDRGALADEGGGPRRRRAARPPSRPTTAAEIVAALKASERGRRFIDERVVPYQSEFGWHAVWSHEFIFPTVREQMEPVLELVRGYLETDYDYPSAIEALRRRHRGRLARRSSRG